MLERKVLISAFAVLAAYYLLAALAYMELNRKPIDVSKHDQSLVPLQTELPDMAQFTAVKEKKAAFFGFMVPLIAEANLQVLSERDWVEQRKNDWNALSLEEQNTARNLGKKYRTEPKPDLLLARIDTWPTSLVLAQAALESAWGTSRFATKGNNLFGQWCYKKGCGLVPVNRKEDANHEVRKFDSVLDSIAGYVLNLNRHYRYQELRQLRQNYREAKAVPDSIKLTEGLLAYSERGPAYVEEVQSVIRFNKLQSFDQGHSTH